MPSNRNRNRRPEYNAAWEPNPGPQTRFLALTTFESLYGGAAGGGKSDALLMGAVRHVHHREYQGLLLRRTLPELKKTLIRRSQELFPSAAPGAEYNGSDKVWCFPSGARIYFGYLDTDDDRLQYQGAEFQYIAFDELTHFSKLQYEYLISRARSSAGIPTRIRASTNPGGPGHDWVMQRWAPWLDPESPTRVEPGQVLWLRHKPDGTESDREEVVTKDHPDAFGRVFVPARLSDNPALMLNDPGYAKRLNALDPVTRAQLRDGNWLARPSAGLYFKRGWFELVDAAPVEATRIRYWDRAATEGRGDWTRGLKLARAPNGLWFVESVVSTRSRPQGVELLVKQTAELDGHDVQIGIEQDPGQAGKYEADSYVRLLAGYNVRTYPVSQSKITRASPVSAQAEAGNIRLVRGPWNGPFLDELEAFPDGHHDDQVDTLSGAFAALTSRPIATFKGLPSFSLPRRL